MQRPYVSAAMEFNVFKRQSMVSIHDNMQHGMEYGEEKKTLKDRDRTMKNFMDWIQINPINFLNLVEVPFMLITMDIRMDD